MATFQKSKEALEQEVFLRMMSEVEKDPHVSQRMLASELGVAMGMVNAYLKRCVSKGWIKVNQVPAKRFAYYLTPKGFAEKSQIAAKYLATSFDFLRKARGECEALVRECQKQQWQRVLLVGGGELAEIMDLVGQAHADIEIVGVVERDCVPNHVIQYDAVLITDIAAPQRAYNWAKDGLKAQHVLAPAFLHISYNAGGQ